MSVGHHSPITVQLCSSQPIREWLAPRAQYKCDVVRLLMTHLSGTQVKELEQNSFVKQSHISSGNRVTPAPIVHCYQDTHCWEQIHDDSQIF